MGAVKPGLMEMYAVAVQSSRLVLREKGEQHLDRVGAMGMAAAAIALGDQDARLPVASVRICPTPTVERTRAAELAPALWRLVAEPQNLQRVAELLAVWMTGQRRFMDWAPHAGYADRLLPFSHRVLHEWLHLRCGACGGSGRLQLTRDGAVRTLGSAARNTKFIQCRTCQGHGKALMRPAEQAQALGLPLQVFEAAGWPRHFMIARGWIDGLLRRPARHLRRELERL